VNDFGVGCHCHCDGGKTKSTLSFSTGTGSLTKSLYDIVFGLYFFVFSCRTVDIFLGMNYKVVQLEVHLMFVKGGCNTNMC
jgi:hypothetical protein